MTRASNSAVAAESRGISTLLERPVDERAGLAGSCPDEEPMLALDEEADGSDAAVVVRSVPWVGGAVSIDAREEGTPLCGDISPDRISEHRLSVGLVDLFRHCTGRFTVAGVRQEEVILNGSRFIYHHVMRGIHPPRALDGSALPLQCPRADGLPTAMVNMHPTYLCSCDVCNAPARPIQ